MRSIPNSAVAVTPSDTAFFPSLGILFVGTGGAVKVTTEANEDVTFPEVPSGYEIKCPVKRVFATGTDATDLILYYDK